MIQDFKFAFRQLLKSPGFTAVAVVTLALAIGVNSAIFALINSVVLHPMVPLRPQEVVNVFNCRQNANHDYREFSYNEFRELREKGREQWDLLSAEANRIAKEIDGGTWQETCDRLNKIHAPTPEGMRAEYEEWTAKSRSFLRDTGLVTLPVGEECTVEPSPPFQRPILAVASYQRPPAFKDTLRGHFFVPYPPDGTPPEEVQKRLDRIADKPAQSRRRHLGPSRRWP